jgi:hypothetical protein
VSQRIFQGELCKRNLLQIIFTVIVCSYKQLVSCESNETHTLKLLLLIEALKEKKRKIDESPLMRKVKYNVIKHCNACDKQLNITVLEAISKKA